MGNLSQIYQITKYDMLMSHLVYTLKRRGKPKTIYKISKKRYGKADNLGRYYCHKYFNISIGKYSYGYEQFCHRNSPLTSIGAFCSIAVNVNLAIANHPVDYVSTSPALARKEFGFDGERINLRIKNGP